MRIRNLALVMLLLLSSAPLHASEALVTRVRGTKLTLDVGANAGLMEDMEITLIRPPGETIYHPITGEDLGAPEIEIGTGRVVKVSEHAASVKMGEDVILPVRPGDVARFTTVEDQMLRDEEQTIAGQAENERQHKQFRDDLTRLARNISSIQGQITALQSLVKRVERVEAGFRVQLRGINEDLIVMKQDISTLKDQISLYGPVTPVTGEGEGAAAGEPGLTEEDVELIAKRVLESQRESSPPVTAVDATVADTDAMAAEPLDAELPEEEEAPFYTQVWFLLFIVGLLGIAAITALVYMRLTAAADEDEEDEEDEELEEDEDEEEEEEDGIEIEMEEDDIVVEETA